MEEKPRILFICQHNSGRSQMAAAYLKHFAGDRLHVESAGLEPALRVNPLVAEVMMEEGIDIAGNKPQSVFDLYRAGKRYDHVITVCHATENQCPVFPGITQRWHMALPNPAHVEGSREEQLRQIRAIRNQVKNWILNPGENDFPFLAMLEEKVEPCGQTA